MIDNFSGIWATDMDMLYIYLMRQLHRLFHSFLWLCLWWYSWGKWQVLEWLHRQQQRWLDFIQMWPYRETYNNRFMKRETIKIKMNIWDNMISCDMGWLVRNCNRRIIEFYNISYEWKGNLACRTNPNDVGKVLKWEFIFVWGVDVWR